MTPTALRLAAAIVRGWTRLYTWRLDDSVRDARQAEIESDLWEQLNEPEGRASAFDLVGRLLLGIPNDLLWRVEQRASSALPARRVFLLAAALLTLVSMWWMRMTVVPKNVQPPPAAPQVLWLYKGPPPPPPPPPPPLCNPPGLPAFSPCTKWPQR